MKLWLITLLIFTGTVGIFAQRGGKAEPNEIRFAAGKNSASVSGSLANHQEAEYSFTAEAGQTVFLKCGNEFDFRLYLPDTDFDTEWNKGTDSFELPADGEYMLYVRKRLTQVRRARFTLTITIKSFTTKNGDPLEILMVQPLPLDFFINFSKIYLFLLQKASTINVLSIR